MILPSLLERGPEAYIPLLLYCFSRDGLCKTKGDIQSLSARRILGDTIAFIGIIACKTLFLFHPIGATS